VGWVRRIRRAGVVEVVEAGIEDCVANRLALFCIGCQSIGQMYLYIVYD